MRWILRIGGMARVLLTSSYMQLRTLWWGLLVGAIGCGGASSEAGNDALRPTALQPGSGPANMSAGDFGTAPTSGPRSAASGAAAPPPPLPAETEVKLDFEQPQASQRFVYAVNPESGTVSIIDAETQAIQSLETGARPSFLRTLVGSDDAIVLNTGSHDATILRSVAQNATTSTVPVVKGANAIAVAPDGKHAVVYFDAAYSAAGSSPVLQDVSVITLAAGSDSSVGMTVGFRPREVHFAADGSRAYVVTDDGVSVLEFDSIEREGTGIARLITLGPGVDQKNSDVSVTADGRFAMARQPAESTVRLVDLADGSIHVLDLSAVLPGVQPGEADAGVAEPTAVDVSDLDLAPNGEFAVAVARDRSAVLRIPIPGGFDNPAEITVREVAGEVIGSVTITPNSDGALLYTTAAKVERITYLPFDDEPARSVVLRKTVKAVAITPDGETALVIHDKADGDPNQRGIDPDLKIDRSFGYSVLRIDSGDVKLQVTLSMPGSFTMVPDGSALFLLLRDDALGLREVQKIETKSFLMQSVALGSPPVSIGAVPRSKRIFVNQEHADGRITFVDWTTNATRTVTGFELNSRIRD